MNNYSYESDSIDSIGTESFLDDLFVPTETATSISAGTGCPACGWGPPVLNHNETPGQASEMEFDDLLLSASDEARIAAGCLGCTWGPPMLNHNETPGQASEMEFDDLLLSASDEAGIAAGCLGCNWGPPVLNHNETPGQASEMEFDDLLLSASDEVGIAAGSQSVRNGQMDEVIVVGVYNQVTNHNEALSAFPLDNQSVD